MKLSFKRIFGLILLVIIIIVFVAAFIILNRSATPLTEAEKQQALTKILGRPVVLNEKKVPIGDILYKGKYISFLYPAAAEINTPQINGIPIESKNLEDFYFSVGEDPRIYATITVSQASPVEASITDDPGVRLRQSQKDIYKQTEVTVDGQHGLSFETGDQVIEKIAFFFINNRIYTFSVSGSDRKSMTDLYNKIILSLKFL
jgi:hypothetical protein